ncbi:MAG: ExeM/NucH family extracellular endonuclease [Gammaproteobacteria bacterium]|nr:ExeM/NucH family extracellular endonuclease [Gammaproteobacteria bacterium]
MRNYMIWAGLLLAACGGGGGSASPPPGASAGAVTIASIQGDGDASPIDGRTVTVRGIVTGDFQESDADQRRNLGGFFMQDGPPDGDLETSDGIFVFDGNNPSVDVDAGDTVEVNGRVSEYFGETQLDATSVRIVGRGSLLPLPVNLPAASVVTNDDGDLMADLERYEGMLVTFPDTLTVTELRNLERFGEIRLSEGGRLYQFTNDNAPDVDGYRAHREQNARRSIVLDDGLRSQNPASLPYLTAGNAPGYSIRIGDTLDGLTGNLRFSRGAGGDGDATWRVMPTENPVFRSDNPRPGAPAVGGAIRVGAFNVLNFFTTLDTGADICGPQRDQGCRGADSSAEFDRQLAKTVTALVMSDADIIGLTELENNASASLGALVDALNARVGANEYAYVDTGTIHDDVIKAGLVYRATTVSATGDFALLDRSVDSRFNDDRNRPALAQAFTVDATGATLNVVVNHLKSKGSSCDTDGDPNVGDGQGNCNLTRTSAVSALADWVATDPTGSGDDDYLVIGDMNAYYREDPIEAFRDAGLIDLLAGSTRPYSFLFDGQSGAYDYAFASASLAPQVAATVEWHINVDEPRVLDYNLEFGRDPSLFDASIPYRAADHDPVIVGLDLVN